MNVAQATDAVAATRVIAMEWKKVDELKIFLVVKTKTPADILGVKV